MVDDLLMVETVSMVSRQDLPSVASPRTADTVVDVGVRLSMAPNTKCAIAKRCKARPPHYCCWLWLGRCSLVAWSCSGVSQSQLSRASFWWGHYFPETDRNQCRWSCLVLCRLGQRLVFALILRRDADGIMFQTSRIAWLIPADAVMFA